MSVKRELFITHRLTSHGRDLEVRIESLFIKTLQCMDTLVPHNCEERTKMESHLEQACFFAKKAITTIPDTIEGPYV